MTDGGGTLRDITNASFGAPKAERKSYAYEFTQPRVWTDLVKGGRDSILRRHPGNDGLDRRDCGGGRGGVGAAVGCNVAVRVLHSGGQRVQVVLVAHRVAGPVPRPATNGSSIHTQKISDKTLLIDKRIS